MKDKHQQIEEKLDLSEITIRHGVHSFKYGTSSFLIEIFDFLKPNDLDVFYDLGSGYGVVLNYAAKRYPETLFIGLEILKERFLYSQEIKEQESIDNLKFYNSDLFNFNFSDGTIFYIFNPVFSSMYEQLINKLKQVAEKKEIIIIAESKCDCFDTTAWLKKYHEIKDPVNILKKVHFYKSIF